VQIARVQDVAIDQPQAAHACAGQVLKYGTAEAPQTDDENAGASESCLALRADFLEQLLP
jgi:hypothetical protein